MNNDLQICYSIILYKERTIIDDLLWMEEKEVGKITNHKKLKKERTVW